MDKTYLSIAVLVFVFVGTIATEQPRIFANRSQTRGTWQLASTNCNLVGAKGPHELDRIAYPTVATPEAWIGAYKVYTAWIGLVGCYHVDTSQLLSWKHRVNKDTDNVLGRCVEFCNGYRVYGLSRMMCFCVPSMPTPVESCRPALCSGMGDFCGGDLVVGSNATTQVKLYQRESSLPIDNTPEQFCLTSAMYISSTGQITYYPRTRPCNMTLSHYACEDRNGGHSVVTTIFGVRWAEAGLACGLRGQVLTRNYTFSGRISNFIFNGTEFWVGVTRREYMTYAAVLPEPSTNVAYLCMTAEVATDGKVRQRQRTCTNSLPAWCMPKAPIPYSTLPATGRNLRVSTQRQIMTPYTPDDSLSSASIAIIVMSLVVTIALVFTLYYFRKKMKRRIYIGSPRLSFIPADSFAIATANNQYSETKLKNNDSQTNKEKPKVHIVGHPSLESKTKDKVDKESKDSKPAIKSETLDKTSASDQAKNHHPTDGGQDVKQQVSSSSDVKATLKNDDGIYKDSTDTADEEYADYGKLSTGQDYASLKRDGNQRKKTNLDMDYDHLSSQDYAETNR